MAAPCKPRPRASGWEPRCPSACARNSQPCRRQLRSAMNKPHAAVLVIDDEAHIRRFIRAGFELEGFTVSEAENASVGLQSATVDHPDLIILDLGLPDMHGSEVLVRWRASGHVLILALPVECSEAHKVTLRRLAADVRDVKPDGCAEV